MAHEVSGWPILLAGTVQLRSYVLVFLAVFLVLAGHDLGWDRAFGWLGWGWGVALAAEYASTRIGIPFGLYYGVVLFNLGITGWIGERNLLWAGILVHVAVFLLVYALKAISVTRGWTVEWPAGERVAVITTTIDERGH
jgi:NADH:ubiquinone oxidoreductase subunit K